MSRTLLLHSVSYAGLWGQAYLPVDRFVTKAAELGFGGVMLMAKRPHVSPLDYGPSERLALRRLLEQYHLTNLCVAGYCNLTADLEHGEMPHREIQVAYLTQLIQLTADLGGTLLRVFTGYDNPAAEYGRQWRLIVEILREASHIAADHGVTLGVQNHHDIACGWESMADLIREVGERNCRTLFDAWAPALQGANLTDAAKALAAMTVHTTIADYQLRPRYRYVPALVNYEAQTPHTMAVPMGEGFIDYRAFLAGLAAGGFDGSVAYEMCSPLRDGGELGTLDRYAREFIHYMQQLP
jgi:sugar phosphate isomerase/epimerase